MDDGDPGVVRPHPMHRLRLAVLAMAAAISSAAPPALAWQATVRVGVPNGHAGTWARALAVDDDGNVAVGGITDISGDHGIGGLAVLSHGGRVRWTRTFAEPGSRVLSLQFDRRGDLIVGARIFGDDEDTLGWFVVLKLDGRTGAEQWRDVVPNDGGSVLVDEAGDAIVGVLIVVPDPIDVERWTYRLRKLSGADGTERWRVDDGGLPLALDASGVVVHPAIAKRALDDGRELWRGGVFAHAAVVDRAGDVIASGAMASGAPTLTKLSGTDGRVRWARTLEIGELYLFSQATLAVDASGDVVIGGNTVPRPPTFESDLTVRKLSGTDGSDRWRVDRDGEDELDLDRAFAIVVDRKGDVVVAGRLDGLGSHGVVMELRGRDGALRWERRDLSGLLALTSAGGVVVGNGGALAPLEPRPSWWLDDAFVVTKLSGHSGRGGRALPVQ
jgi:outer membrane protein assembly factor BamB